MAEDINHNIIYEETPLVANVDGMEKTEASELSIPLDRVLCFLYISHFLSRWGDRMWEFAVGLFMIAIRPDSLVLPALYGLVESASVAVFGVVVGKWVDRFPRLKVAQFSLGVQNGSIVSAASLVVILLIHVSSAPMGYKVFIMLITLVNAFGAIGALAGLAGNILVERDWVVTIADGQTPGLLAQMNSGMRRIDLTCKLLAPIAVGIIMSRVSTLASALLIAVWNIVSVCFEYWMLYSVYYATPALQLCKVNNRLPSKSHMAFEVQDDGVLVLEGLQYPANAEFPFQPLQDLDANLVQNKTTLKSFIKVVKSQVSHCLYGSKIYIYQEAVFATMSLALLYFTVLSFGTLMTAFLQMRGVPPYVLGLSRGLAALVGIGATFVYPMLQARVQTIRAGIWSIWMQWTCLGICVGSLLVQSIKLSSIMLIVGVIASRLGLWMFDLSVTQLMQESVAEADRGVVGGVQNSLQSLMDMLTYVLAVFASHTQDFWKLVLVSYGVVSMSAILYSLYVRQVRGHLVHMDQWIRSR